MPVVIHPRVRKLLGRTALLTCLGVLGGAGTALAACPAQPVSQPFSQWGDQNDYFVVPGGSFEGGPSWDLENAVLTSGNEPFTVGSAGDSQSLTINAGGSATTPFFCVDNTMSSLRLFTAEDAPGSDLRVRALVQTGNGVIAIPLADLADGSVTDWAPTPPITGDTSSLEDDQTVEVALQFRVPGSAGSWQLDDVYVDPFRSG